MQKYIKGIKVNYEFVSKGKETIVFLHGWGGSLNNFKAAFKYFENSEYSLLNIDLPPFGESSEPPINFTIYNYSELVLELIKSLNIKIVHLVGHSFGGRISVILAAFKDVEIKTLTLVAAAGIKPHKNLKTRFKLAKYKFLKRFTKNKQKLLQMGSRDYKNLSSNMKSVFINVVNEDLSYLLCKITCPTLIIWAKDDKETPVYMAKKFNKKIKNSGLYMFSDGGHFAYLNHHNQFVRALDYFMKN